MRKLNSYIIPLILFSIIIFGLWKLSRSRKLQVFGTLHSRVETQEKVIALTFDDGPAPIFTDEILQILTEENIKATFFLVGSEIEKSPEEGKKIVAAGHEIGNHSYSHSRMVLVKPSFVREEIERTDAAIRFIGYDRPAHFRPPFGDKLLVLPFYLSQNNRKTITWDVECESLPVRAASSDDVRRNAVEAARPGSIILLHVMQDKNRKSMTAVKPIIRELKRRGFRFVTVSELIEYQNAL